MKRPQKSPCWSILEGKLIQRYALLIGDDALYQFGKESELNGRLQRQTEKKQRLNKTAKKTVGAIILFLMASTAGAQVNERPAGSLSLGPQAGYFKSKDADDARVMWGAALRLKVSDALGIEGSVNYRTEEYSSGTVKVQSWPVMVTGLLYPVSMLYGAMGLGWYNSSIEYLGDPGSVSFTDQKQTFGWHFGGGVELPVGSAAKIVGDVRYVFLNYDFQHLPVSKAITNDFYVIDVSLLFNL